MLRRDFASLLAAALSAPAIAAARTPAVQTSASAAGGPSQAAAGFQEVHDVTAYAARFVVNTRYENIPPEVIELGKKSILDGFGLALAGARAESGGICLRYLDTLALGQGESTVIGTSRRTAAQFAALVNGV